MSDFLSIIRINQKGSPEKTAELIKVQLHEWLKQERFQTVDEMLNVVGNNINEYLDYVVHTILDACAPAWPRLLHYEALSQQYMRQTLNKRDTILTKQQERINEAASIEHTIGVQVEKAEPTLQDEIKGLKEAFEKSEGRKKIELEITFHEQTIAYHNCIIQELKGKL